MQVTATARAAEVVSEMAGRRSGELTVTIGTGCCESTAPFLYEDFWPGPDQAQVGEVAGVPIYAPEYLRVQYPDTDGVVLDVSQDMGESLSVETELGVRLILRGRGFVADPTRTCDLVAREPELRPVVGQVPDSLRGLRLR